MRGEYDKPGEKVEPGVPASLPPLSSQAAKDRPAGAGPLAGRSGQPADGAGDGESLLAALFRHGAGEDGRRFRLAGRSAAASRTCSTGWRPSSSARGWDVKRLAKADRHQRHVPAVVEMSPALLARDPENRLLARGPRFRLPAEMIRDEALATSGLLDRASRRASVKPYQPAGLWEELGATAGTYPQDHGATSIAAACTRSGSGRFRRRA